jgi:hypothetical protein
MYCHGRFGNTFELSYKMYLISCEKIALLAEGSRRAEHKTLMIHFQLLRNSRLPTNARIGHLQKLMLGLRRYTEYGTSIYMLLDTGTPLRAATAPHRVGQLQSRVRLA